MKWACAYLTRTKDWNTLYVQYIGSFFFCLLNIRQLSYTLGCENARRRRRKTTRERKGMNVKEMKGYSVHSYFGSNPELEGRIRMETRGEKKRKNGKSREWEEYGEHNHMHFPPDHIRLVPFV